MGCHALLQGIFLTQGSNLGFLHCRQILYCLSHQGSPAWWGYFRGHLSFCNETGWVLRIYLSGAPRSLPRLLCHYSATVVSQLSGQRCAFWTILGSSFRCDSNHKECCCLVLHKHHSMAHLHNKGVSAPCRLWGRASPLPVPKFSQLETQQRTGK